MALITTSNPQWKATISDVNIQDSSSSSVKVKDYTALQHDVDTLVNTTLFQEALAKAFGTTPSPDTLNIRVIVQDACLTITDLSNNKELLTTKSDPTKEQALKETITKVNAFAISNLQKTTTPPQTPLAPSTPTETQALSKLTPDQLICQTYGVHGLSNDCNVCYANAAYQLLHNIPSLKSSVLDKLPSTFAVLQNYPQLTAGKDLMIAWNAAADASQQFPIRQGFMASEFFDRMVGQIPLIPKGSLQEHQLALKTTHIRKNGTCSVKTEPSTFISLRGSPREPSIIFDDALKRGLSSSADSRRVKDDEVTSTTMCLAEPPKQLAIKISRVLDGGHHRTKDSRALLGAPLILDLNSYDGMLDKDKKADLLELKGFVVHEGSNIGSVGGHYTSYFQKTNAAGQTQWFFANDSHVVPVTEEQALQALTNASDLYYDNVLTSGKKVQEEAAKLDKLIVDIGTDSSVASTVYKTLTPQEVSEFEVAVGKQVCATERRSLRRAFQSYSSIGSEHIRHQFDSEIVRKQLQDILRRKKKTLMLRSIS